MIWIKTEGESHLLGTGHCGFSELVVGGLCLGGGCGWCLVGVEGMEGEPQAVGDGGYLCAGWRGRGDAVGLGLGMVWFGWVWLGWVGGGGSRLAGWRVMGADQSRKFHAAKKKPS